MNVDCLRLLTDDEVIASWLKGDMKSSRQQGTDLREALARDPLRDLHTLWLEEPDTTDLEQNEYRRQTLRWLRGWRNERLFEGFPTDVTWHEVIAKREQVNEMLFINQDHFLQQTLTRNPLELLKPEYANAPIIGLAEDIKEDMEKTELAPMIAVAPYLEYRHPVMLEGNARLAAFPRTSLSEIKMIIGVSQYMENWNFWYPR